MGREFDRLFDEWAPTYDETVSGVDPEYAEVFMHYEDILNAVSSRASGHVLEYGVGTGNLTEKLLKKAELITGVEPSSVMRKIASTKLPSVPVLDGDFFHIPQTDQPIDTIVSTYAFHHLTDNEKEQAIALYSSVLAPGGKIIFADTMFPSKEALLKTIHEADAVHYDRLAEDLRTEYYTTIPFLQSVLEKHHFRATFQQLNPFVWLMEAVKQS